MKLRLLPKEWAIVVGAPAVLVVTSLAIARFSVPTAMLCGAAVSLAVLLFVLLEVHRRTKVLHNELLDAIKAHRTVSALDYNQIESLLSLYFVLKPSRPLPQMRRSYAACPDFLKIVADTILSKKPKIVTELGSGVSTLIIAYCLKETGAGKLISVEHDAEYAARTREHLATHGLDEFVTIVHAPLKAHTLGSENFSWYDLKSFAPSGPIEVLVIDGPPEKTGALARYPAIPLMKEMLAGDATVLLDDGYRPAETAIAARWRDEFGFAARLLPTEAGTFVFTRS